MKTYSKNSRGQVVAWLAVALAALALGLVLLGRRPSETAKTADAPAKQLDALAETSRTKVLRVGWGGFPPYTRLNPNETDPNKRVEGFMIDVVNEIAKRAEPSLKVEWHLFQWDSFRASLASGEFDFIADPVYLTVGRAMDFQASEPISYFGIAVAVVREDETRFSKFSDLDREGITVALAAGYTSTEYALKHLSKPTFKQVPIGQDAFVQLDEVLLGRADVALNDVPTVLQYVNAHKGKVKALWLDNPPAIVAGGFLARKSDRDLMEFLNNGVRILRADGTLKKIDEKWKTFGMFPEDKMTPAAGLR